jgi:hypothetical protein
LLIGGRFVGVVLVSVAAGTDRCLDVRSVGSAEWRLATGEEFVVAALAVLVGR